MSATTARRELAGDIHASLLASGLASLGSYLPPTGEPEPAAFAVAVYVREGVQAIGSDGQVLVNSTVVIYLMNDFGAIGPEVRGRLTVDGQTWVNVECLEQDAARSRWRVSRG